MTSSMLAAIDSQSVQLRTAQWASPPIRVQVLNAPKRIITLGVTDGQGGNLRIRKDGTVDGNGNRGPWARFMVEPLGDDRIRLKSLGHLEAHATHVYLQAAVGAGFSATTAKTDDGIFAIVPDAAEDVSDACPAPTRILTQEERATFIRDGVLILRGLVQPELVDDALRTINHQLGLGSAGWTADEEGKEHLGVGSTPAIKDLLLASPAKSVAEQLLGPLRGSTSGPLRGRGLGGQVALRFPMDPAEAKSRAGKSDEQWHIDGQKEPHMNPFQLLVGVALSSQPTDECGNLHVWPGLHPTVFAAAMRQRALRAQGVTEEGEGIERGMWLGQRPKLPEEACMQVKLEPGDVVLLHQKVPHRIGFNRSPHVRYQIYFRLAARGHDPEAHQASVWDGWGGMSDAPAV